jgi:hypothetical protein
VLIERPSRGRVRVSGLTVQQRVGFGLTGLIVLAAIIFMEVRQHDDRLTIALTAAVPALDAINGLVQLRRQRRDGASDLDSKAR